MRIQRLVPCMAEQETDPEETETENENDDQGLLARIKGLFSRS